MIHSGSPAVRTKRASAIPTSDDLASLVVVLSLVSLLGFARLSAAALRISAFRLHTSPKLSQFSSGANVSA